MPGRSSRSVRQLYRAVLLDQATTLTDTSSTGDIVVASALDGNYALTLSSAGQTIFSGAVGGTTPLASLTTVARGGLTRIAGGEVITSGAQTYGDAVQLGDQSGQQTTVTLQSNDRGSVTFNSTLDAGDLTVNTGGLTVFNGLVGSVVPLNSLTTDNQGAAGEGTQFNMNVSTPGALAGVRVAGAVTINDPVLFNVMGSTAAVPTILTGVNGGASSQTYAAAATLARATVLADGNSGAVVFNGTVDGAAALTVNTAGLTGFNGAVGETTALTSLTTDATGTTRLNAGSITTTGNADLRRRGDARPRRGPDEHRERGPALWPDRRWRVRLDAGHGRGDALWRGGGWHDGAGECEHRRGGPHAVGRGQRAYHRRADLQTTGSRWAWTRPWLRAGTCSLAARSTARRARRAT